MRIVSGWLESRNGKICADELEDDDVFVTDEVDEVDEVDDELEAELVEEASVAELVDEAVVRAAEDDDADDEEEEEADNEDVESALWGAELEVVVALVELCTPPFRDMVATTTTPTTKTKAMTAATTALPMAERREPKRARA
jgi:hypothetical protein